jgi:hypothetical protein
LADVQTVEPTVVLPEKENVDPSAGERFAVCWEIGCGECHGI